jgi:integrase
MSTDMYTSEKKVTKEGVWTQETPKQERQHEPKIRTDLHIRALKPGDKRKYYRAGRDLWLEVFPSGVMAWRFRYRLNGRAEKVALGKYPEVSLKDARNKRDEMAGIVARGESPARQKQLAKTAVASSSTVREFGERFFAEVAAKNRKDASIPRRYLDAEIYPAFGQKKLSEVTIAEVQTLIFKKRDNGFPAAAAGIRGVVKRLYDYAIVCGVAVSNPALATPTRFITQFRPRTRALDDGEVRVYLETLYASGIRRQFKLALHIILMTLVRKSELLMSKWSYIDFDLMEWRLPGEIVKNEHPHVVYMSTQVAEMFAELKKLAGDSVWVLPGRSRKSQPFAKNALNKALEGISFDMEPCTIHDHRRTASTRLNEMGFSSDVVEKALNHEKGGMKGIYNKAEYATQRREMLQCWADHVNALVPGLQSLFSGKEK